MKATYASLYLGLGLGLGLCSLHMLCAADLGNVGEKWVYEVEGPRPMSNPPASVDGDRLDEIISVKGEGADRQWELKSIWGKNDDNPSVATLDAQHRVRQVIVGSMMTIGFTPPVPTDWPALKPGESTTFETKLAVMGFEMPLKYEVKRLADETITVPAGKFAGCRHIQMVVHATDPSGQPTQTRYDHWMSAEPASWLIQEIVVTNAQSDDKQRSRSSLKQHIVP